jgi:hypothetical protein
MKIKHKESNSFFEITEAQGNYTLIDSTTNQVYKFSQLHDVLWKVIEQVRTASYLNLPLSQLSKLIQTSGAAVSDPETFLKSLRSVEINRIYYDRIFMKLLANYRMLAEEVVINNKSNFIIDDEIIHVIRKKFGIGLRLPSVVND